MVETKSKRALRWFLKHDVWLIPTASVACTGLTALISRSKSGEQFWVALEAMLLAFTVIYLIVAYYAHYEYLNDVLKTHRSGLAGLFIVFSGLALTVLTLWVLGSLVSSCPYPPPVFHIGLPIASIGCAILSGCFVLLNGFDTQKMKILRDNGNCERVRAAMRYRRGYKLGVKYCDIPTLLGFLLLATVVALMHWRFGTQEGAEQLFKTFVGGTVTFHLMLSNFVYAATSGE